MNLAVYAQFVLALIFVLGLIGLCALLLRRFAGRHYGIRGGRRRLSVREVLPLDARRRLMLVRRDRMEYLLLLSASGDKVVERGIPVAADESDDGDDGEGRTGPSPRESAFARLLAPIGRGRE